MWGIEQIANLAEIIGATVVVVTLIYLTIQPRQNNVLLRSQSRQALLFNDQASILVAFEHADAIKMISMPGNCLRKTSFVLA